MLQIVFGKVVLVASLAVDRPLGEWLRVNIKFAQAVDYDVCVNVACAVFTIGVSTDQSLMPRKICLCIQVGMGESQTIKTMIHEVAHAMLHNSDFMKQRGEEKDRLTKETEAESIAFTVCSVLGIDTSDYSFPYVASWASGKEMKELKDSMDTIRLTAADFLEKLEAAVAERSAERMTAMVFCADCGRPMEFERLPHGAEESKKVCYYICKARQADDKCIGHQITEKLLKALLMDQLHLFITQLSDRRKVVEELRKIEDVQNPVYRAKGEIMSLTDKVSQMAKKREQLYADYVAGVVDSEDYQLIREDYSRQYDGLRAALQEAENKKVQVEQQIEEYLNMTSHLEEHLDNFEFDIQLVKSLVQKIEVSADKRIRIVFGFRDVFTELGKESAET